MSEYRIYLNEELTSRSEWLPVAVAAWDRASRDRDSAQHGGQAVLLKDDIELARVQPETLRGHPWPDAAAPAPGLRELAAAIQQLARHAGVDQRTLADALTANGLPTTRGRLDGIKTNESGKRAHVTEAELIAICYAAISALKNSGE